MPLVDPISAYNADTNVEAQLVRQLLDSAGVEAHVIEDHSMVGYWMFGVLPEIHKPQVWINRSDAERAAKLLADYEIRNSERRAERHPKELKTIVVECEECGQSTPFAGSLLGTVQDCPHCGAYVDVGTVDWAEDEDFGEPDVELEAGE